MSDQPSSYRAVVTALFANILITAAKFVAFFISGSGAMLSEAVHSAADAGNQVLLFVGLRRGMRGRDEEHPYGYDAERFVWGILSAAGIFFVGAGVTIVHGIEALFHPHMPEIGPVTFGVLFVSLLLEGGSMAVAVSSVVKDRGDRPLLRYLFAEADPAALAIILEDGAAVVGLFLAGAGIGLCYVTQNPMWDALGSIVVGLLLAWVALHLVRENRELLVGVAIPAELEKRFVEIVSSTPGIRHVHDVKTRQLSPEAFKLKAEITIDEAVIAKRLAAELPRAPHFGTAGHDEAVAEATVRVVNAISDLIDELEARVQKEIPQARHIDLEVDHTAFKRTARDVVSASG